MVLSNGAVSMTYITTPNLVFEVTLFFDADYLING